MMEKVLRLRHELGGLGLAALAMLAAAAAFHFLLLEPLQAKNELLKERAARQAPRSGSDMPGTTAEKVAAVYAHLRKDEETTDWLAKLHGIGAATGVQLKSASYRSEKTQGRIVRYEMVLPLAGSYPQIRDFLQRSLAEIPVMSVDQLTLKRESRTDGAVQAELRMTLHMVKS
jgi:Tfp pilus assembly protein PilO